MKTDLVVSGYLIHHNQLLLIHHKKLDKWLPPGGHIDQDETPDHALKREFKEEVNLDIEFISKKLNVPFNKVLATPFYVEVHNVGDHDHCCFFYLCRLKENQNISIRPQEIKEFKWFKEQELNQDQIPKDVQTIAKEAFKQFRSLENSE